jgi:ABC-type polysaccharide/polyol phosphate export permease
MLTIFKPFYKYKFLLYQLVQREIKARYKQSVVGYFWVILNPLVLMAVYTFVFSVVFRFPVDIPYPLFLFAALLPWNFLQQGIMSATNSLVNNDILLKKVAFPREVIPYSVLIAKGVDFLFSLLLFLLLIIVFKVNLSASIILFIPILIIQVILMTGLALLLSTFNLFYRDIQYLTNLVLMVWMYMSPVVYPLSMVPAKYIWLYKLNPMVGIIEGYRAVIFGYPLEYSILSWALFVSLITLLLGFLVFKKFEKVFADIV